MRAVSFHAAAAAVFIQAFASAAGACMVSVLPCTAVLCYCALPRCAVLPCTAVLLCIVRCCPGYSYNVSRRPLAVARSAEALLESGTSAHAGLVRDAGLVREPDLPLPDEHVAMSRAKCPARRAGSQTWHRRPHSRASPAIRRGDAGGILCRAFRTGEATG